MKNNYPSLGLQLPFLSSILALSTLFFLFIFSVFLTGCHPKQEADTIVKVGVISGPEAELMNVVKNVALKKYGLQVEVVVFSDYTIPNIALNDGSIDANMFQHKPYLDQFLRDHRYPLMAIGKTFIYPMGIYSKKITDIHNVSQGAIVAIPNDPSNEARALLLVSKAGLITLTPNVSVSATLFDIASNPKKLNFKELDAAQLPRILDDVDLAVINTNYAIPAGLSPRKNAIFMEDANSPYANLIVVRAQDAQTPKLQLLVKAFQSPEILAAADKLFNGAAVPAWK